MTTDVAQRYADQSRRFILQAQYELEKKGDRYQASEKASDAVAQAVKGYRRGPEMAAWFPSTLRRQIIDLLSIEFGRPELRALQSTADQSAQQSLRRFSARLANSRVTR